MRDDQHENEGSRDVQEEISLALEKTLGGAPEGPQQLFGLLYEELRVLAQRHLRGERVDHTLQATALVNEAWLKLADQRAVPEGGRDHFLSVASGAMRRILIDHARARGRDKRGGGRERVVLSEEPADPSADEGIDLTELDRALEQLAEVSERQAKLVELRFFGGLGESDIAGILGCSVTTVQREWRIARAWLGARLG